ncbi:alcohol dehydrogenase [Penicillium angulare]|uniref:Alcohol dehydrogenase n=1 Tax=Penicillium angulare TaxID=116970 RepID=A0A9W9KPH1_9EURO|nr:alcohol dehydrogenase [Penicillium angulare]
MPGIANLPPTMKALIAGEDLGYEVSDKLPIPTLLDHEVLVKVERIGLNPVDTKLMGSEFVTPGLIWGFDCAGRVVAIGKDGHRNLKIGDRVCGSASGMNKFKPEGGAFAEYIKLDNVLALKVPEHMTMEEAATLGTALASACMSMFWAMPWSLGLLDGVRPEEGLSPVLVYGGSTATGTMIMQFLKYCGFPIITTCSPHNFDLVKSYGADYVYDYKSENCAQKIREDNGNCLEWVIDCISEDHSMRFCYAAMGRAGGNYVALNPINDTLASKRKVITPDWILATRIAGDPCAWPAPFKCEPEPRLRALCDPWFDRLQHMLDTGAIKPHPLQHEPNGLAGVKEGVQKLRRGEISGIKLVYSVP